MSATGRTSQRARSEERLAELILYIAQQSENDRGFGKVKLLKLLAYADFEAYARLGEPITASRYRRLEHGPAPSEAPEVLRRLLAHGELREARRWVAPFWQTRYIALRRPNLRLFNAGQLEIVNEVLFRFRNVGSRRISEASHRDFAGWQLAGEGEEIAYHTALLSAESPSDETLAEGRAVMDRLAGRAPR
jgi:uncharacterized phage-associated protein